MRNVNDMLAGLEAVQEWLRNHGAAHEGRLEEYRATLRAAGAAQAEGAVIQDHRPLFAALMEVDDLVTCMSLPEDVVARHRRTKLAPVWTGAPFYDRVAAADQDQGRDAVFELVVAAQLQSAGYAIDFDAPADVVGFENGGVRVLIECKRPKTNGGVDRSIVRASQQLARARGNGCLETGLIALDLTRLANPEFRYVDAATVDQAFAELDRQTAIALRGMREELTRAWQDADPNALTDGVLLRVRSIFHIDRARLLAATMWRVAITTADGARAAALRAVLERLPSFDREVVIYAGPVGA